LEFAPEAGFKLEARAVAELAQTAGDGHSFEGSGHIVVVVTAVKVRIDFDGANLERAKGNLIGGRGGADGQHYRAIDPRGIANRPFEHAHAAHGTADHAGPDFDLQVIGEGHFYADLVSNGDDGEPRAEGQCVRGQRGRTGCALAGAQHVRAHHEVLVGVDGQSRTDDALPPPGRAVTGERGTGGVGVTA
jgi:hypothetical protein